MGNHSYAITDFEKAYELDPKFECAYFYCGVSYLKKK